MLVLGVAVTAAAVAQDRSALESNVATTTASADPLGDAWRLRGVPADLYGWVPWAVRDDTAALRCTAGLVSGAPSEAVCAWPGALVIAETDNALRFRQDWTLLDAGWVPLPGQRGAWPMDVSFDGAPASVIERNGRPYLYVEAPTASAGVAGRIAWTSRPATLAIPPATGLVLTADGAPHRLDADGQLWLDAPTAAVTMAPQDALSVKVFRWFRDSNPIQLVTRIELSVTGRERSLSFQAPLPEGFVPHRVASDSPAAIDQDGVLRIQAGQGGHLVEIHAHATTDLLRIPVPRVGGDAWPETELWSFRVAPELRGLGFAGLPQIDPSQTEIPAAWRRDRAFLARTGGGEALVLSVDSRADLDADPGQVKLARDAWLDFSGRGLTFRDLVTGTLHAPGRFASPLAISRVELNGQPWVVSELASDPVASGGGDDQHAAGAQAPPGEADPPDGIEVPAGPMRLVAEGRVSADSAATGTFPLRLPSNGWIAETARFQSVETTLNVPPGWMTLAVFGVDNVPDAWLTRWDLLDLFLVILIAALFYKTLGLSAAALWTVAAALTWHLSMSPGWLWLPVMVLGLLWHGLAERGFHRSATLVGNLTALMLLGLAVALATFTVQSVSTALFPQLTPVNFDREVESGGVHSGYSGLLAPVPTTVAREDAMPQAAGGAGEGVLREKLSASRAAAAPRTAAPVVLDADAKVGTGPGIPSWTANRTLLSWRMPNVPGPNGTASVYLVSPVLFSAVKLLGAAALVLLYVALVWRGYRLHRAAPRPPRRPTPADEALTLDLDDLGDDETAEPEATGRAAAGGATSSAGLLVLALLAGAAMFTPHDASAADAGYPPAELLEQLRTHLLRAPTCAPNCAAPGVMEMAVARAADGLGWDLNLVLEVAALHETSFPLPGRVSEWQPGTVRLNGALTAVRADSKLGVRMLRLPPGTHRIEVSGALPPSGLSLTLGAVPTLIRMDVPETWRVDGVSELGLARGSISVTPSGAAGTASSADAGKADATMEAPKSTGLKPFSRVARTIVFGPKWTLSTRVTRLSGVEDGAVVRVPLIAGEQVLTPGLTVRDGSVEIVFAVGETERRWDSELALVDRITLQSAPGGDFLEQWTISESPLWRVTASGDEAVSALRDGTDRTWRPWPGQSITLDILKPRAVAADTMTVLAADLSATPRRQGARYRLRVNVRSSQGDLLPIRIAAGSEVQSLLVNDGRRNPAERALADGRVELAVPIDPGLHRIDLEWTSDAAISAVYAVAPVTLGVGAATNLRVEVEPAENRWVLWTSGPLLGPAVTFWALLAGVIVIVLVLGAIPGVPLTRIDWFILLVGAIQSLFVAAVVVGWVLAFSVRGRLSRAASAWRHNGVQLLLILLTAVAFAALVWSIPSSLLGQPEMHITGNGSSATALRWYQDRVEGVESVALPQPEMVSVPVLFYRGLMLLWALLVVRLVVRLADWAWGRFTEPVVFKSTPRRPIRRAVRD
jgi:hypothetical protein